MNRVVFASALVLLAGYIGFQQFIADPEVACAARASDTCNPKCGACSVNVKGNWTFFEQERSNSNVTGPFNLTLTQTGYQVKNTNESSITFTGTVFANSINFSITVSGEEIEGYVKYCEGHVLGNKLFALCNDRDSTTSTFTGQKG